VSRVAVVIPAGGSGRRMGGVRKELLELLGTPVLARTMAPFLARSDVTTIAIAVADALLEDPPAWLLADARVQLVHGGAERTDSVRNALAAIKNDVDIVVVHDAARPLVSGAVIERCIVAASNGRCAIAAIPVVDTIKEVDEGGRVVSTPDRRTLWAAQTPQAFPAAMLRDAHARAAADGIGATDDAALVARYGGTVVVVAGAPENIKITTPADVALAEALLARVHG
jgi:2-C-methyl-D-erythritol 4-phosphate cytidylyltransferase